MAAKKILVCYYGLPRATKRCLTSIRRGIIAELQAAGADVDETGLLIWQERVRNPRSREDAALASENYRLLDGICERIVIDEAEHQRWFSTLKEFGDSWNDGLISLSNIIRQLICLRELANLLEAGDYDQVVLTRVDLYCHRKLSERERKLILGAKNEIILPVWGNHKGVNDRFMVCPTSLADRILRRLSLAEQYCRENGAFQSEKFLAWIIGNERADTDFISLPLSRVRVGDVIHRERFKPRNVTRGRKLLHSIHRKLPTAMTYPLHWYY